MQFLLPDIRLKLWLFREPRSSYMIHRGILVSKLSRSNIEIKHFKTLKSWSLILFRFCNTKEINFVLINSSYWNIWIVLYLPYIEEKNLWVIKLKAVTCSCKYVLSSIEKKWEKKYNITAQLLGKCILNDLNRAKINISGRSDSQSQF